MTLLGEQSYTARSYLEGSREGYRFNPGEPVEFPLLATIEPIPRGEDLVIEGVERTTDAKRGWTEYMDLQTANEKTGRAADEILIDDEWYEVMRVQRWPHLSIPHVEFIVRRRERQ